jgi:hypothetical protein
MRVDKDFQQRFDVIRIDEGAVLSTDRNASLKRRTLPKLTAKAISVSDSSVSWISRFAACTRRAAARLEPRTAAAFVPVFRWSWA